MTSVPAMSHSLTASVSKANSLLRTAIASLPTSGCNSDFLCRSLIGVFKGTRHIAYVQGQSPRKGVREYFYYIDHQGQVIPLLFL